MPTINEIAPESVFTIELNAGAQGRQGPQGPQGVQGPVGPEGKIGPKPIRGIDYFTQQDISNMVTTITGNSNSAFNENVSAKTKEFNANVSAKTSAFDNNAVLRTEEFNTNANSKKTDFNLNANDKTTEFNQNASNKKTEIDTYVEEKQNIFDRHVEDKISEFEEETSEYITETELENKGYLVESDLNGYAKEEDLFSGSYNDLKDKPKIPSKTSELTNDKGFINEIPSEYVTEEEQEEFIKPYNDRITENEKYISDLEATIDILTNTNTAKGELVHITDALSLPTFENKVNGNVEQETTTGKNLFDVSQLPITLNGVTISQKPNGDVVLNGTPNITEGYITFYVSKNVLFENLNTGYYTLSVKEKKVGIGLIVPFGSGTLNLTLSDTASSKTLNVSTMTSGQCVVNVRYDAGTLNDFVLNPQLEYNSTATEYEPFTNGASPNPEYPQEIEVVEGDLSYKVNGKNLWNSDFEVAEYDINGNKISSYVWVLNKIPIRVKPNTTYTISQKEHPIQYRFIYFNDDTFLNILHGTRNDNGLSDYTFTTPKNCNKVYVQFRSTIELIATGTYNMTTTSISEPQLEESSVATDYEPYKEQIVYLDLKGNWVGAINDDIKDYLVTDKKKYWLVKNVGKVVLDGNTDINYGTTDSFSNYIVQIDNKDMKKSFNTPLLSNYFTYVYDNWNKDVESICVGGVNYDKIQIKIKLSKLSEATKEGVKAWFSTNNTEVYYPTEETEIIELGELPEPIKTFEGVNNIQVLANLDTEIEVTYALDLKKYFDNKLASIQEQIL